MFFFDICSGAQTWVFSQVFHRAALFYAAGKYPQTWITSSSILKVMPDRPTFHSV